MKLTILGDIMAERPVLQAAKCRCGKYKLGGVFDPSRKLLAESDYIIGNLETPLAGEEAVYSQNHVCFNAPDEYVDALLDAGIKLVSTTNNHTFDRGYAGMERTIKVLDEKGLPHTGTFLPGTERQEAYYFEQDGTKFAVIAYTYGTNYGGSLAGRSRPPFLLLDGANARTAPQHKRKRGDEWHARGNHSSCIKETCVIAWVHIPADKCKDKCAHDGDAKSGADVGALERANA